MYVNRSVEITPENQNRFQSFIVFEPASARISDNDILIQGDAVREYYDQLAYTLDFSESLQDRILKNRTDKIGQMLDLLVSYENVIITKFFDRIWRRYSYVSNISEVFLDYPTFKKMYPDFEGDDTTLLAQRIDSNDDDDDDTDSDTDSDSDTDDENNTDSDTESTEESKND